MIGGLIGLTAGSVSMACANKRALPTLESYGRGAQENR